MDKNQERADMKELTLVSSIMIIHESTEYIKDGKILLEKVLSVNNFGVSQSVSVTGQAV